MKKILFFAFLFSVFLKLNCQTKEEFIKLGNEAFKENNYLLAINYYEKALPVEEKNVQVLFRLAEAYRLTYNFNNAEKYYRMTIQLDKKNNFQHSLYLLAMMLKTQYKYEEAIKNLEKFIETNTKPHKIYTKQKALEEIEACKKAMQMLKNPLKVELKNMEKINTEHNEFNPVTLCCNYLVFSSLRPVEKKLNPLVETSDYLSRIYVSDSLGNIMLFDDNINSKIEHTANITFSPDFKRCYFNRCEYINNKLKCDIYYSEYTGSKWTKPVKMPAPLNHEKYTSTQPFLVVDESGNDILYFSSNRSGGFGEMDIWMCVISKGKPQKPINLGNVINTPGNEITPFYDVHDKKLYFSSDWHAGMGGYDIFYSKGALTRWEKPVNPGYPINSGSNDFNFSIKDSVSAYISTNRPANGSTDEQFCCNDILLIKMLDIQKDTVKIAEDISKKHETPQQSRRREILELLPLSLYFDNDHPNPKTTSPDTKLTYEQTWREYIKRKDEFIAEYSKNLNPVQKARAEIEMQEFFEQSVESGMKKLEIFTGLMYQDLLSGSRITIKIKGFTSPLTTVEYNLALAKRRIKSLINYFYTYENGALVPFINKTAKNGATLTILEEPVGEILADPYVSDNPAEKQKSIYSIGASRERRIQILLYESDAINYENIKQNIPIIYIPDNHVDLSNYIGIENYTTEIEIINIGKETLTISDIETSSNKIVLNNKPKTIAPQKSAKLEITFKGTIEKNFIGHIVLHTNTIEKRNVIYISTFKMR